MTLYSSTVMPGLSPRVRGTATADVAMVGLSPPKRACGGTATADVYPRACGGTQAAGAYPNRGRGSIPARAGEPALEDDYYKGD